MILHSLLKESLHSLLANRMRSLLAMLGIVIGVASVIVMVAIGQGGQMYVRRAIESLGSNIIIVTPKEDILSPTSARKGLTLKDYEALRYLPELAAIAPVAQNSLSQVRAGNAQVFVRVVGTLPDYFEVRSWKPLYGTLFTEESIERNPRMAIIGINVSQQLFKDEEPIGRKITISNIPFVVNAVLEPKGRGIDGIDQDDVVILPQAIARDRVFTLPDDKKIKFLMVRVKQGVKLSDASDKINETLRISRKLRPEQESAVEIGTLSELARSSLNTSRVMTLLLGSIASISLVVGGIGIMNIMYVCVTERTREIGIRKSIGARNRDILIQFLLEAVVIALMGCALGVVAGLLGTWIAETYFQVAVSVNMLGILLAVGASVSVGVFFGYYPARRAARLLPVEALRYQ